MTLLYTQGFEGYLIGDDRTALDKDFNYPSGILTTEAGLIAGRNGNGVAAFYIDNSTSSNGVFGHMIPTAGLSSQDDWIVGFAFYNDYNFFYDDGSRSPIIQFIDSDGDPILSVYMAAGTINVKSKDIFFGTKLGFADVSMTTRVWYFIECKVNFHPTTGSVVIRVNEEQVLNLTGLNTTPSANLDARPSTIALGGGHDNQKFIIDDVYICDDQESVNNDFLGDVRIERLNPVGAGSAGANTSPFTPLAGTNWASVADAGTSGITDDDASYVESSTVGDKDTYDFANSAITPANVVAVSVKSSVRKTDAGSRTFVHVAGNTVTPTEVDSATLYPSVTYHYMESIFETDPVSGVAWLMSEVSSAEFGLKVTG